MIDILRFSACVSFEFWLKFAILIDFFRFSARVSLEFWSEFASLIEILRFSVFSTVSGLALESCFCPLQRYFSPAVSCEEARPTTANAEALLGERG